MNVLKWVDDVKMIKSSKISECNFRSRKERETAIELEERRQRGEIKVWRYEVPYSLIVNGKTVCVIIPDFTVVLLDGRTQVIEVKGGQIMKTPQWSLKRKIFKGYY